MKTNKGQSNTNILLWWTAIISLAVSGAIYYFLGNTDDFEYNQALQQMRTFILLIGVIIAGICVIAGTASRWFYPK